MFFIFFNFAQRLVHKIIGKKEKVNVIAVDWHGGAANNNYLQSAADLRLVARIIAQLIRNLIDKYAISPTNIELIGHSLGGQICGFVGREFTSPKIGHIIGLLKMIKSSSINYLITTDHLNPIKCKLNQ